MAADTTAATADWRSSVSQSYRNAEVRHIAQVLASLEEAASTSSKMMLAMRFENNIFKSASSLEDYRKRMTKRLQKVQKNYKPPVVAVDQKDDVDQEKGKQSIRDRLVQTYGAKLLDIHKHAPAALQALKKDAGAHASGGDGDGSSGGPDRAAQLQTHVDDARRWADQLGVAVSAATKTEVVRNEEASNSTATTTAASFSPAQWLQLEQHLVKRVENIRRHVLRYGDPSRYALEALQERDDAILKKVTEVVNDGSSMPSGANVKASRRVDQCLARLEGRKRRERHDKDQSDKEVEGQQQEPRPSEISKTDDDNDSSEDPVICFRQAYDQAVLSVVPPPVRGDDRAVQAGLAHVAKMRASAEALARYFAVTERQSLKGVKGRDNNDGAVLTKLHDTAVEGMDFCLRVLQNRRNATNGSSDGGPLNPEETVQLEDAWTKTMDDGSGVDVVPSDQAEVESAASSFSSTNKNKKRKLEKEEDDTINATSSSLPMNKTIVTKARMLLQTTKPATHQLLLALARKGCKLYHHSSCGGVDTTTTHLVLDFGKAFQMTIWLSPLFVQLRALPENGGGIESNRGGGNAENAGPVFALPPSGPPSSWKPLSFGLTGWSRSSATPQRQLSVWGVQGEYGQIGHVVEERLRDASTRATRVLRKCFARHVKDKVLDHEIAILETSALVEFLHLARTTYMPGWQDHDS